jgi:rRNA maturation endonuclease Nob1
MTECFWCSEVYDSTDHDTCPSCGVNTDTKTIKIVSVENTEGK